MKHSTLLSIAVALAIVGVTAPRLHAQRADDVFVVIAHADSETEDVTTTILKRIFLGEVRELGGERVMPVNLDARALRGEFLTLLTGKSERQLEQHFVRLELRGEGRRPPEIGSPGEMVELVARSKRAIGWLRLSDLNALDRGARAGVKVLRIDGKAPADTGYALRR